MQYLSLQQGAQKVLRLSERMLAQAEQGNWDQLSGLENERSRSLESLFSHPAISENLSEIAGTLFEVISIDKECLRLGAEARKDMLLQLNRQSQGGRALKSYMQNAE